MADRGEMNNLNKGLSIDASYKFRFIWPSIFRGKYFLKSTNQKEELTLVAMFANGTNWAILIEDLS